MDIVAALIGIAIALIVRHAWNNRKRTYKRAKPAFTKTERAGKKRSAEHEWSNRK
ncbi:hypothetical protein [Xanthomonas phage XAJ2]|uniref:Uncharacterized protein n=1 Tax=Xanthomonas phage XAJ2 TaxID=1775249 RepID=A0A1I9L2J7_9CAUD|nr:hypothetical protein [Xanthomonas phage XAJ2]